jgi:2',3'-cyclic-nucleotide 2'-phosphodiesterase (5'-nucleotidase family)
MLRIFVQRYVQQDLDPDDITTATIMGILSTSNEIVEVEITGENLIEIIETRRPLVAGVVEGDGYRLSSGELIDPYAMYKVLMPDNPYAGGFYYEFYDLDPETTYTGINWRDPAIDWIASLGTSRSAPLELTDDS